MTEPRALMAGVLQRASRRMVAIGMTILFVGYSLSDLNIRFLLHRLWKTWRMSGFERDRPQPFVFMIQRNPIEEAVLGQWDSRADGRGKRSGARPGGVSHQARGCDQLVSRTTALRSLRKSQERAVAALRRRQVRSGSGKWALTFGALSRNSWICSCCRAAGVIL
jgi:hypothetical protein